MSNTVRTIICFVILVAALAAIPLGFKWQRHMLGIDALEAQVKALAIELRERR